MYAENSPAPVRSIAATRTATTRTVAEPRGLAASPVDARITMLAVTAALTVMAFVFAGVTQFGVFAVAGVVLLGCTLLAAAGVLDAGRARERAEHAEAGVRLVDAHDAMRGAVFATVHPSMHATPAAR